MRLGDQQPRDRTHGERHCCCTRPRSHDPAVRSLLPGRSGSGKSTLVAAFVAAGFEYLTDDAVRDRHRSTVAALAYAEADRSRPRRRRALSFARRPPATYRLVHGRRVVRHARRCSAVRPGERGTPAGRVPRPTRRMRRTMRPRCRAPRRWCCSPRTPSTSRSSGRPYSTSWRGCCSAVRATGSSSRHAESRSSTSIAEQLGRPIEIA